MNVQYHATAVYCHPFDTPDKFDNHPIILIGTLYVIYAVILIS